MKFCIETSLGKMDNYRYRQVEKEVCSTCLQKLDDESVM